MENSTVLENVFYLFWRKQAFFSKLSLIIYSEMIFSCLWFLSTQGRTNAFWNFTQMSYELYYSVGVFFFLRKKVNMLFHFLIVQAHLQHGHLFFHRAPGLTSYTGNKWPSKIMNVFKHSFLIYVVGSPIIPRENEGGIPPNMPFSPSSSHLSFLPKSCFHVVFCY